jgi:hypothetical protein
MPWALIPGRIKCTERLKKVKQKLQSLEKGVFCFTFSQNTLSLFQVWTLHILNFVTEPKACVIMFACAPFFLKPDLNYWPLSRLVWSSYFWRISKFCNFKIFTINNTKAKSLKTCEIVAITTTLLEYYVLRDIQRIFNFWYGVFVCRCFFIFFITTMWWLSRICIVLSVECYEAWSLHSVQPSLCKCIIVRLGISRS